MNYETDIIIDESALDVEWLDQPKLMLKYSKYLAECEKQRDLLKEEMDLIKSELDLKIRENPDKFGISKVTEGAVNSAITKDKGFQKVNQEYLEARYELNVAKGAVNAFEQRKNALENLVRLHGQQYFAGPKEPRDIKKERQERKPEASPAKIKRR